VTLGVAALVKAIWPQPPTPAAAPPSDASVH
jgi:hypothetical protein